MVLGNVKDKWCFSTLSFMKSKFRNRWKIHLDLVVKIFAQDHGVTPWTLFHLKMESLKISRIGSKGSGCLVFYGVLMLYT
jgi:hypothetical protein